MKDIEPDDRQLALDFDASPETSAQLSMYAPETHARASLKLVYSRPTYSSVDDHTRRVLEATIAHARSLSW